MSKMSEKVCVWLITGCHCSQMLSSHQLWREHLAFPHVHLSSQQQSLGDAAASCLHNQQLTHSCLYHFFSFHTICFYSPHILLLLRKVVFKFWPQFVSLSDNGFIQKIYIGLHGNNRICDNKKNQNILRMTKKKQKFGDDVESPISVSFPLFSVANLHCYKCVVWCNWVFAKSTRGKMSKWLKIASTLQ